MPPKRKRGPYKQYLLDPTVPVPRSTIWFRAAQCANQLSDNNAGENQLINNAMGNQLAENTDGNQLLDNVGGSQLPDNALMEQQIMPPLRAEQNMNFTQEVAIEIDASVPPNHSNSRYSENYEIPLQEALADKNQRMHLSPPDRNGSGSSSAHIEVNYRNFDSSSEESHDSSDSDVFSDESDSENENNRNGAEIEEPNMQGEVYSSEDDADEPGIENVYVENLDDEGDLGGQDVNMDFDGDGVRQPLYNGAQISSQESDILIMSFIIRWGLEDKAIDDLLRLIDCHMPVALLGSKYLFLKKFPTSPSMQTRFFCRDCSDLLPPTVGDNAECECGFKANVNDLKRDNHCFVQLSISEQIQHIMTNSVLVQQMRKECTENDVITGKIYKRLRARKIIGDDDLTLQWNTDGVKPFKSSKVTFYPIQACINELPPQTRRDNMLLCGLYYGKGKPDMNIILKPFVDELKSIHSVGIDCNVPSRGLVTVKVHTLLSSVDSVARPMLQGIMQFNGRYGCSFCLRRGKCIERGRGRARVYVGSTSLPRTVEQHVRALETLEQYNSTHRRAKTHVQGVKRGSILILLPVFNIIKSFVPEYLHAALEGVVVTFWKHWCSSEFEGQPWHLTKQKRTIISARLEKICPPVEVTRPPQSLDDLAVWKASEIKSFLLYYSLVCMKDILPNRYLKHWFLFVYSMTIFLREKIVREEFLKAQQAIVKFVEDIRWIYPNCHALYTFNTHLLLHIPKSVEDFGGLWASSTFPYEHFNGVLTRLITGTQSVPTQVCRSYLRLRYVTRKSSAIFAQNDCSEAGFKLYKNLLSKYHSKHSQIHAYGLRLFGKPDKFELSLVERNAIEQFLNQGVHRTTSSFRRMIIRGKVFHSSVYGTLTVRDNSYAETNAGLLVYINRILLVQIVDSQEVRCVALCNEIQRFNDELCCNRNIGISSRDFVHACLKSDRVIPIFPSSILHKCVGMLYENALYVSPLVNSIERD